MKTQVATSRISGMRAALLLLSTIAIGSAPFALSAQTNDAPPAAQQGPPPGGPGGGPGRGHNMEEHRLEMLTRKLSLTPDQVTQVKAVMDSSHQQMMALREDTSTSRDQKRPKMEAIHQEEQAKIKAVLNDDQKAKLDAIEARMREQREEHREHGDGAPPPPPQS